MKDCPHCGGDLTPGVREAAVLAACLRLIEAGLYPGRDRLARLVPGWSGATAAADRDRLVARGELTIPGELLHSPYRVREVDP